MPKTLVRKPSIVSLILCRAIDMDPTSTQYSIRDALTWLPADDFPHEEPQLAVFYEVAGYRGFVHTRVRIVKLDEDEAEVVTMEEGGFECPSQLALVGGGSTLSGAIVFPDAGWYVVELFCNGELESQRRLFVGPLEALRASADDCES